MRRPATLPKRHHGCSGRSIQPGARRRNPSSCAPPPASPGCGAIRAGAPRPTICSRRSTAGSPRASTPPTSRTPRHCSMNSADKSGAAPTTSGATASGSGLPGRSAESGAYPLNPRPLTPCDLGEAQLFRAFCPRGALQRTLWDGNGGGRRVARETTDYVATPEIAENRIVPGAPYQIKASDLRSKRVAAAANKGRPRRADQQTQLPMFPPGSAGRAPHGHRDHGPRRRASTIQGEAPTWCRCTPLSGVNHEFEPAMGVAQRSLDLLRRAFPGEDEP